MKKFLLSCFVALGIGVNAQYNVQESFDSSSTLNGLITFGTGASLSSTQFCNGNGSVTWNLSATVTQVGPAIDFSTMSTPQHSNAQKITVSINHKKPTGTAAGTLYLTYNKYNPATSQWSLNIITSKTIAATTSTTCGSLSGTINAGIIDESTLAAGEKYSIGAFFVRSAGSGAFYFDDLSIVQDQVTTPPNCTTFTAPTNGSTINGGNVSLSWPVATGALGYKLTIGTTSGSSNIYNNTVTGTSIDLILAKNTTYFAKLIPTNANGDASGCTEISFTTNNNTSYCTVNTAMTEGTAPHSNFEKISKVTFSDLVQSSTATTGYSDYTAVVGNVEQGETYAINIEDNAKGTLNDVVAVWIDYNQNGSFSDPGEEVFKSSQPADGQNHETEASIAPWSGNITIPTNAIIGNTRMRVRLYDYYFTPNTTPCGSSGYGEVEDYTLNIKSKTMGVSDINKTEVSIYPNPFTDVLKISDVKDVKSVSINDISGREVKSLTPAAELNLSNLKTGLYIVNLKMEDGSVKTFKAIKK